jgi:mannose-6-phosphate isomerase-like protein (cupin superfamily)
MSRPLIENIRDLPRYSPPSHVGTENVRLVERDFCGTFEMIRGVVQPGGEAEPHFHAAEHQVFYVLSGEAEVKLGDEPSVRCGPGTVVRIPPRLMHRVTCAGSAPLEVIIVYSPPLPKEHAFHTDPRRTDAASGTSRDLRSGRA